MKLLNFFFFFEAKDELPNITLSHAGSAYEYLAKIYFKLKLSTIDEAE